MSVTNYIVSVTPRPAPVQVVVLPSETVQVVQPAPPEQQVVYVYKEGPPGPRGEAGRGVSSNELRFRAANNLSGHRALVSVGEGKCDYADSANPSHAYRVIGISTQAAVANANIDVQSSGRVVEPSWNWTPDLPVFCGPAGVLTQTPPTTGFSLSLGVAEDSTTLILKISEPIILA